MAKSFDQLVRRTTTRAVRQKAARRTRELLSELLLGEVRKRAGLSQRELARKLHIKQPSLSKLEGRDDMQISTLDRIVKALGGRLHISASFPAGTIRLLQFDRAPRAYSSRPGRPLRTRSA